MRILKGWTKDERKELEEAKYNGFLSAIALIHGIGEDDGDCRALTGKCYREEYNNNQLVKDIADYYAGVAKFAERKYYVHLIKKDEYSYLNINSDEGAALADKFKLYGWQTEFTREEVVAINPNLVPFMEEVEDDERLD